MSGNDPCSLAVAALPRVPLLRALAPGLLPLEPSQARLLRESGWSFRDAQDVTEALTRGHFFRSPTPVRGLKRALSEGSELCIRTPPPKRMKGHRTKSDRERIAVPDDGGEFRVVPLLTPDGEYTPAVHDLARVLRRRRVAQENVGPVLEDIIAILTHRHVLMPSSKWVRRSDEIAGTLTEMAFEEAIRPFEPVGVLMDDSSKGGLGLSVRAVGLSRQDPQDPERVQTAVVRNEFAFRHTTESYNDSAARVAAATKGTVVAVGLDHTTSGQKLASELPGGKIARGCSSHVISNVMAGAEKVLARSTADALRQLGLASNSVEDPIGAALETWIRNADCWNHGTDGGALQRFLILHHPNVHASQAPSVGTRYGERLYNATRFLQAREAMEEACEIGVFAIEGSNAMETLLSSAGRIDGCVAAVMWMWSVHAMVLTKARSASAAVSRTRCWAVPG
eukprot:TRINITY_DN13630_c0_g2_i7.p1 TRINITY_DN13630_c0_g2~~TRINITY_DN13630_c0_g2_i7.p1  ORF type:complete len:452 (-),score=119.17 TRINITY_DN13630_c0_g2_i7:750-2105(-)